MADSLRRGRRAGLLIPLFSFPSTRSWGIGDIADVVPMTAWLAGAGQHVLQLLPLNEMSAADHSPYSAISAMAIDPVFICVPAVPEFVALGDGALGVDDRDAIEAMNHADRVNYATVRRVKLQALTAAFERFEAVEWRRGSDRARELRGFLASQAWWVDDYALFRAIRERSAHQSWTEWPHELQTRDPEALEHARRELSREILFYQYLQWIADRQWKEARAAAHANGVSLFGDLPFMVDTDSADVWGRQQDFRLDISIGVPPDQFSDTGQDWGMPLYDWDAIGAENFRWLHDRARRSADLYDGFRVDHLVGFYRTYGRPRAGGEPFFTPAEEPRQRWLGERVLEILAEPGSEIIAEDLGLVPDFVRASLDALRVPGFRVFRWERRWNEADHPFRDPSDYPAISVATSGTHDTEPLIVWWQQSEPAERQQMSRVPLVQRLTHGQDLVDAPYDSVVRDALLEALFASNSRFVLLPVQDVFGWADRINEPATVTPDNWTFRLPWPCDRLDDVPIARERQRRLRAWATQYERL
jgi:4-alpha-glucanotransferase